MGLLVISIRPIWHIQTLRPWRLKKASSRNTGTEPAAQEAPLCFVFGSLFLGMDGWMDGVMDEWV